jgi:ribokinase
VLGIFVADVSFRSDRLPRPGETILGRSFGLSPGGKGSNQAVAAARAGARVRLVTRLGDDAFAAMARGIWREAGVDDAAVTVSSTPTGSAFIHVDDATGQNAIIVVAGAAGEIGPDAVEAARGTIAGCRVFVTGLEVAPAAALRGLEIAREAGAVTVFNPAPAVPFDEAVYPLCDVITPNESEASALTGVAVSEPASARAAGDRLLERGVGCAILTLGAAGVLVHDRTRSVVVPALPVERVVDTTGAGDAFTGALAAALAEGRDVVEAARFGVVVAGLSVGRAGAAAAMPSRAEIDAALAGRA